MDAVGRDNNINAAVDLLVFGCDICATITPRTAAVGTKCGHYFCSSCLTDAYRGESSEARPCPVCDRDIREEIMSETMFVTDTAAPTINEAFMARMDVVEDHLKRENERLDALRLYHCRRLIEVQGARITELEQDVQNLLHMSSELLHLLEIVDPPLMASVLDSAT